jgi:hypothetical protein
MKMSTAFPSKYLRAADLQDRPHTMVMHRVEMDSVADGEDKKPVLYFTKAQKGLVLNKTNSKVIVGAYGDDSDHWEGRPLVIFPTTVDFRGDMVEALRVRIPKAAAPAAPPPPQHDDPMPDSTMDDEIPF